MSRTSVDIQKFADYRTFLLAYLQDRKMQNPKWSLGRWAQQMGLKSTSSISKILAGERAPGSDITEKLVRYLDLKTKDAEYFRSLVQLDKIRSDPKLSVLLMEKVASQNGKSAISQVLDPDTFTVISNWYHFAIRELTRFKSFQAEPKWIVNRLLNKITEREAQSAVDKLLKLGLLKKNPKNNKLEIAEGSLHTTHDIASQAIQRSHKQLLQYASEVLDTEPVETREYSASSIAINKNDIQEAKKFLRNMRTKFVERFESNNPDTIYQLQFQLFPLAKDELNQEESL